MRKVKKKDFIKWAECQPVNLFFGYLRYLVFLPLLSMIGVSVALVFGVTLNFFDLGLIGSYIVLAVSWINAHLGRFFGVFVSVPVALVLFGLLWKAVFKRLLKRFLEKHFWAKLVLAFYVFSACYSYLIFRSLFVGSGLQVVKSALVLIGLYLFSVLTLLLAFFGGKGLMLLQKYSVKRIKRNR